jgi:hypothetical protein
MFRFIAIYGLVVLGAMLAGSVIAAWKNRDASRWAAWCFLFPPSLLLLAVLPRNPNPLPVKPSIEEQERQELARDDY